MFTGMIEEVGKVLSLEERRGQKKLMLKTPWTDLQPGENISVNGISLTVIEPTPKGEATFVVSEENLEHSTLGLLEAEKKVNLERSMILGSRMGGHWVQGQVDAKGMVLNMTEGSDHHKVTIALDKKYGRYCVQKGSISINGVSLTIHSLTETKLSEFMVSFLIAPHVWKNTTLSELKSGDFVNVEVDILAKYVERLCPQLQTQAIAQLPPQSQAQPQAQAPIQSEPMAEAKQTEEQPQAQAEVQPEVQPEAQPLN